MYQLIISCPQRLQARVVQQFGVQLVELGQRVLVVVRSPLSQDLDLEVGFSDLLLISKFIFISGAVTFLLEFLECLLQLVGFVFESSLDNLSSGEKPLFESLQSFILDFHGLFMSEFADFCVHELLKDRVKEVFLLIFSSVFFFFLATLLHLVSGFVIVALLEDVFEDYFGVGSALAAFDFFFFGQSGFHFCKSAFFLNVDLSMTVHFHFVDLLEFLLVSVVFGFLVVKVFDSTAVPNELLTIIGFLAGSDFAFTVMLVNLDDFTLDIELSLTNLVFGWQVRVEAKLLNHALDLAAFVVDVVDLKDRRVLLLVRNRLKCH
mmetsp:Transcript_15435/g.15293  ORF Transcript_15435/g.15293 Transcript_15435/m.15293 type:complete len:320 (-) Transcript_15435:1543-2502(-)